uniref:ABC transporter ATP-binding protein n=1 Tax=Candidatus Methanomethylicus mesodigestus TaxID=1867258 RepID=A0A7C3FDH3_9CREN
MHKHGRLCNRHSLGHNPLVDCICHQYLSNCAPDKVENQEFNLSGEAAVVFIELRNVTKKFGAIKAVENLDLAIHYKDFLAVVGPSGAGKSTLLRIIDCLESPTSGDLLMDGVNYEKIDKLSIRQRIGMVFQNPVVFNTSVYNNIAYSLRFRKVPDHVERKKVGDLLKRLQLINLQNRKAITLSGGEAQRVTLARVLVYDPQLLLLDEPTANLDPYNASIIEEALIEANREYGTTIVIVTHDIFQAKRLANKVAFMLDGKVVEYGDARSFFEKPSNPKTKAFIDGEIVY